MSNRKDMITYLIAGLIKNIQYKMRHYFLKPYEPFGRDINVKADLQNYATKASLMNAGGADTSKLAAKSDLTSLKAESDKLDVDKLKTIPNNLSNLINEVDK